MTCQVDMDIRRHADEQGDEAERDAAIEARAVELMAPGADYYPLNDRNFDEAIGESMVAEGSTLSAQMAELLRAGNDPEFVALVRKTAHDYMKRLAMIEAETQIDEGHEQDAADYHIDRLKDAELDAAHLDWSAA